MFFQSKLFKILLPLLAYLLFAFQWAYNYISVWKNNIPDETKYLKGANMGFYMGYAYLFIISFVIFITFGIFYLLRNPVSNFIKYVLIGNLFLMTFFAWHYSNSLTGWQSGGILSFLILVLFAFSIFRITRIGQPKTV
jgi:hypothetical protein